jgi:hypothetical protein
MKKVKDMKKKLLCKQLWHLLKKNNIEVCLWAQFQKNSKTKKVYKVKMIVLILTYLLLELTIFKYISNSIIPFILYLLLPFFFLIVNIKKIILWIIFYWFSNHF